MGKNELEKCLSGELFNGSDKTLSNMALQAKRIIKILNNTDYGDYQKGMVC